MRQQPFSWAIRIVYPVLILATVTAIAVTEGVHGGFSFWPPDSAEIVKARALDSENHTPILIPVGY